MSNVSILVKRCCVETLLETRPYTQPYQRSGHCSATDGKNLYVFGGYHPEYVFSDENNLHRISEHHTFRDLWCYNLASKTWYEMKTSGTPPSETASMSMILSRNTLVCFGGTLYPWGSYSNDKVYTLNLTERVWRVLECINDIPAKYGQAMVLLDNSLYVYGGCRHINKAEFMFDSELFHLDMKSLEWSQIHSEDKSEDSTLKRIRGMYKHGLAYYDQKLYVIGSSWEEIVTMYLFHKVHVFDLVKKKWSWKETIPTQDNRLPQRRAYHSCVQWKSEVYMCGGHDFEYHRLDDIWCLHLPDLRWEKLCATLPIPSFFHSAVITDTKCMYLFGGVIADSSEQSDVRTKTIQRIWLGLPSLAELSWQFLLNFFPKLVNMSQDELVSLGIPRLYTARLKP